MTLDLSRINWLYIGLAIVAWLAFVIMLWRKPNADHSDQFAEFKRSNPGTTLQFKDWLSLCPPGVGPVPPGRREPIILASLAFWATLLILLIFGFGVIRVP